MKVHQGLVLFVSILLLFGCASSEQARDVQPTGFLTDYSKLRPGGENDPILFYRDPKLDFRNYDSALIDPISISQRKGTKFDGVPEEDLQRLARLLKVKAIQAVKREMITIVHEPGPRVMRIRVALTEVGEANTTMHVVSTAVPLPSASKMATGTRAFVGTAAIEAELLDSVTGEVLMAAVDRRGGGRSLEGLGVEKGSRNSWDHVEKAFQYWSDRFSQRICQDRGRGYCTPPE